MSENSITNNSEHAHTEVRVISDKLDIVNIATYIITVLSLVIFVASLNGKYPALYNYALNYTKSHPYFPAVIIALPFVQALVSSLAAYFSKGKADDFLEGLSSVTALVCFFDDFIHLSQCVARRDKARLYKLFRKRAFSKNRYA